MKIFNTSLFRAFVAIVVGVLMVRYRENLVEWLTKCIGVLFFISGIVSIVVYYVARQKAEAPSVATPTEEGLDEVDVITDRPAFPIVGLGSIILGVILFFMTTTFISYLVYIFAAMLILGAIGEYVSLVSTTNVIKDFKKKVKAFVASLSEEDKQQFHVDLPQCGLAYWVLPTLLLLFGIWAIMRPMALAETPFLFIGIAMIFYGLTELLHALKHHSVRKTIARHMADIEGRTAETMPVPVSDDDISDAIIVDDSQEVPEKPESPATPE